jgi:threonine dehydratase
MRAEIEQARQRITNYVRETPIIHLEEGVWGLEASVTLKLELLQHTGSFKPRGAFNRMLSAQVPAAGVIAASGGNHGAAVAYAALKLGYPVEIFVPEFASQLKIQRLRYYGAQVTQTGANVAETLLACQARAEQTGALMVHPYDQPEVIAGQGTLGLEFAEQAPHLDTVLAAAGGGGMLAGVAAWFANEVRVVGVEPINSACLHAALQAGRPVDVEVSGIAADALGARRVGELAFALARTSVERVVLVSDESIHAAQSRLWNDLRVIAEPGGATALSALLSGAYQPAPGERVGVIVCGGNTSPGSLE